MPVSRKESAHRERTQVLGGNSSIQVMRCTRFVDDSSRRHDNSISDGYSGEYYGAASYVDAAPDVDFLKCTNSGADAWVVESV